MCNAAADHPPESLSLIYHRGRFSITLAQYPLPHLDEGFGLGEEIDQAIRKILKESGWPTPNE
jgi:hypothetical protein